MKPKALIIHHTVTDKNITPEALRAIFKSRFGVNYIGYNFYIMGNGKVHSDIGAERVGIHNNTGKYNNSNSVGVALAGNFEDEEPTSEQLNSLSDLIKELQNKYNIPDSNIVGHRDMKSTVCPGKNLYKYKPWKKEVKVCKIDDQKAKDMRRHLVYLFIKTYYHREPTEKEVADHADWIDRDSGDSFNYKGMAEWVANQVNEKEFKANWVSKKEYDNATKVAQEKCNATIANIRSDYTKEIDRLTKIIKDKDDDIVEIEAIMKEELKKSEKKVAELEKQLNGLTERVVYESLIWNWIKKLFRKE